MEFLVDDPTLTVKEIEKLIEETDVHRAFSSRFTWHANFVKHFEQILKAKQIVCFRHKGMLMGICSWAIVTRESKKDINKSRWTLPENISEGDMFYVDVCLLRGDANIHQIKDYLKARYRPTVKEVFWYNVPSGKRFRLLFKGGTTCPKELIAV